MYQISEYFNQACLLKIPNIIASFNAKFFILQKMFYGLRPVREGFGMKLMKRMGWREGEPLGKTKEGHIEPIPVDVKTDRQGIVDMQCCSSKG